MVYQSQLRDQHLEVRHSADLVHASLCHARGYRGVLNFCQGGGGLSLLGFMYRAVCGGAIQLHLIEALQERVRTAGEY